MWRLTFLVGTEPVNAMLPSHIRTPCRPRVVWRWVQPTHAGSSTASSEAPTGNLHNRDICMSLLYASCASSSRKFVVIHGVLGLSSRQMVFHSRNAGDVPLYQDLLLTFEEDCKPLYGLYNGPSDVYGAEARSAEEADSRWNGR